MHFRCPNCEHQIAIVEDGALDDATLSELTCPTCNSQVSLATDETKTVTPAHGLRIGSFEVRDILGQGSFGIVYKAWDDALQRHVAIKIPRPGRITGHTAAQFLREARAAAGITHDSIVSVLEIGQHEDVYYIVTEFIEGISLSEWLRIRPSAPPDAAALTVRLCQAVQAAHERGIVHRDLKPGNILMDHQGRPHITDFGLAKQIPQAELTVTDDGHVVGTPAYMSPEQARGERRSLNARSDVYSLGVILYEMMTGQKPFAASDSGTVIYRILTEEPRAPRAIRPEIHRDLETICLRALSKEPERRYASAQEFADDLTRYLDGRPIMARRVGYAERLVKLIRRNRAVSILIALLLCALMIPMLLPASIPEGYVRIRIATQPEADWVRLIPHHRIRRTPIAGAAVIEAQAARDLAVPPGLYRVQAGDDDGRFHEVWRQVEPATQDSLERLFRHQMWKVADDGVIELPSFRIVHDDEIVDEMVRVPGGAFDVGYETDPDRFNAKHTQQIPDLLVGKNEVPMRRFRAVMRQPLDPTGSPETFLDLLAVRYGSRSSVPDAQPVTGYPVDVAILYCELAGGRLPGGPEWEAFAVRNEGSLPASSSPGRGDAKLDSERHVVAADDPSVVPGAIGLNLTNDSVGEFTDSASVAYISLYPESFGESVGPAQRQNAEFIEGLPFAAIEVRGAPGAWIRTGNMQDSSVVEPGEMAARYGVSDVRDRTAIMWARNDPEAATDFARVGWRMVRRLSREP